MKHLALSLFLLFASQAVSNPAMAQIQSTLAGHLELIMYERAGCVWCAQWDQEIAPIYPKAEIGRLAPLRRVNLDRKASTDPVLDDPVRFTPTFVLLREGKEVGRITGYHHDAFFWGLLESMVERLTKKQSEWSKS
jgi:thioredoxin-related protein